MAPKKTSEIAAALPNAPFGSLPAEWPSHAKIVELMISHLKKEGWSVETISGSEKIMRGTDIMAKRSGKTLIVAAKGYPASLRARTSAKGAPKPTLSLEQAHQWYGQVLMNALLRKSLYPEASMFIALPDYDIVTSILPWIKEGLERLEVGVFILSDGKVKEAVL